MDFISKSDQEGWQAMRRLVAAAQLGTGQGRKAADFLLARQNAEENGGWALVDLWNVDDAIADDMLSAARFIRSVHSYPNELGLRDEIAAIWNLWRGGKVNAVPAGMGPR